MMKKLLSLLLLILLSTFSVSSQILNENELEKADEQFIDILKNPKISSDSFLQIYREILDRNSVLDEEFNNDFTQAEVLFQQALESKEDQFVDLGIAYGAFKLAIDNNPESYYVPYALYRLGDILLEQACLEETEKQKRIIKHVIPAYEQALTRYPQHRRGEFVLFWLGQFYYDRGNIETAQKYYQKLAEIFENQSELGLVDNALFMVANCKLYSGNIGGVREIFRELAKQKNVIGYEAILNLAQLEPPGSDFQEPIYSNTIEDAEKVIQRKQNIDVVDKKLILVSIELLLNRANVLLRKRSSEEAIKQYNLAIKHSEALDQTMGLNLRETERSYLNESKNKAFLGLGRAYLEKAKLELRTGKIEQSNQNLNDVLESLNQLSSIDEFDRFTRRELNLLLASIHYFKGSNLLEEVEDTNKEYEEEAKGEYEKSIEKYEAADQELPLDFTDNYKLVRAYIETDNTEKAVRRLKKQIDYIEGLAPEYKKNLQNELDNSYRTLVTVYIIQEKYQDARDAYENIRDSEIRQEAEKSLAFWEKISKE